MVPLGSAGAQTVGDAGDAGDAGSAGLRPAWLLPAALVGGLAGAAWQVRQPVLWPPWAYGLLGLVAGVLALALVRAPGWWRRAGLRTGAVALAAALAMAGVTGLRAAHFAAQALSPALEGRDIRVTGTVVAMPQPSAVGLRFRLAVESAQLAPPQGARRGAVQAPSVDAPQGIAAGATADTTADAALGGQPVRLPSLIDLGWYHSTLYGTGDAAARPAPALRAGERWALTVRLKAPHGARNPHGFDYELWLWEQGVQAVGYVRTGARDVPPVRLEATAQYPVEQARQSVRDAILDALATPGDGPGSGQGAQVAGVVAALVTGDQRAIDRADWDVFRATGVAHLMSISGLHITLFAWLAAALVQWLWRRSARLSLAVPAPSAALVGGAALAAAYALFSGWGVPAQRTVTMLCVLALLRLAGLRWPWPQVWLLACAAVVLTDPWALWQSGFWLSFVAVGILFATDSGAASARPAGVRGRFILMLREQWVVTLALSPLGLLLFGQMSLVALGANLLAIPWVTLVVTPLALLGVLWAPLWQLAGWAVQALVAFLQPLASVPWASLWLAQAPLWAGLAGVLGGALLALRLPWPVRALGLPLLLPVLCWQPLRPAPGQFELLAADIGQGSAVLVRTARHSLLYDAGPRYSLDSDAGERVLVPLLRALGERLDVLMLSHRDSDHTGGAPAVLAAQPQALLTGSIAPETAPAALPPAQPCVAGQRWHWDGVEFAVIHPAQPATAHTPGSARRPQTNAHSCVLRITAATGAAALLAGDIERAQEQALVAAGAPLAADVLLLPHHGSKTSSSAEFLDAVGARSAWVQAAYRNRFGHPAPEVVQRVQARGMALVQSAHCGAATWSSTQPAQVQCERQQRARYWQHLPP